MKPFIIALCLSLTLFFAGCSQTTQVSREQKLLEDLTSAIIMPGLSSFYDQSNALYDAVTAFVSTPNTTTLTSAQDAWKNTQEAWQKTESFQFGPADDYLLSSEINYWPKVPATIEGVLAGSSTLTIVAVSEFGATKKGLPVLEYLLFDHVNGNDAILSAFQSSDRRGLYTSLVAEELLNDATTLVQYWQADGGDYGGSLASSSDGLNMVVNQMVFLLENAKSTKVGTPLGKSSGGTPQPSEVESQQSQTSLANLYNNIQGFDELFTGNSGNGLDDYVTFKGFPEITASIKSQTATLLTDIQAIDTPLWEAVTQDQNNVETVYADFTELIRLVKVDMATAINQTVHFNSSDGD